MTTAYQAAESRFPTPAPEPPKRSTFNVPLDPAAVTSAASVNNGDMDVARRRVSEARAAALAKIELCAPFIGNQVEQLREEIEQRTEAFNVIVSHTAETIGEIEALLRERGGELLLASQDRQRLADAVAKLDGPQCLELDAPTLFALEQARKHLPANITTREAKAEGMEAKLRELAEHNEIELSLVVNELVRLARDERNQIVDSQIIQLNNAGLLAF